MPHVITAINHATKCIVHTYAWDYDSFATVILSQNNKGINISQAISVSIKVIIICTKGFPDNNIMGIPLVRTIWPPTSV